MALKIRGNTQILEGSIENTQLKDADVSLAKLSGAGSVALDSSGSIDVSLGELVFANDQISGDAIEGGTIGSIAITSADINGGTIDGVNIATSDIKTSDIDIDNTKSLEIKSGGSLSAEAGSSVDLSAAGASLVFADDQISGDKIEGGNISGDLVLSGGIVSIPNKLNVKNGGLTVDSSGDVSMSGKLTVMSDLEVRGTLTSINTTDLDIEDKLVTLAKGTMGSPAAADGAGIHIDGARDSAGASLKWSHVDSKFIMDADLITNVQGQVSDISNHNTDALAEGSSNLYYTQARFDSAFDDKTTTHLTEGDNLYYTDARFDTRLASKTTTNLAEGDNLYYTDARFDTRLASKTTTNLAEGDNLYYTQARFDAALAAKTTDNLAEGPGSLYYTQARFDSAFDDKTTTHLTEGDNLYYTEVRATDAARAAISVVDSAGDGSLSYDSSTGKITYRGVTQSAVHGYFSNGAGLTYNGSGEFSISNDAISFDMLGCEMNDSSMESASASTVPTSSAIKAYVNSQLSSQSSADFAGDALEYKMSASNGGLMVNVVDVIEQHTVGAAGDDFLLLDTALVTGDLPFEALSMVFINGQKLRHNVDYKFADASGNASAAPTHIHFINGVNLEHEDDVEIRRIKVAPVTP